jgi:dihydroorotase
MKLRINNGRVIDPANGVDGCFDVLVEEGKITAVGAGLGETPGAAVIDATDKVVCPGFIDIHTHLRQPGYEYKETIRSGSLAAAAGGFTSIACMPNTDPPIDNQSVVEFVVSIALSEAVVNVFPVGAVSKGLKGEELAEMGEMQEAGIVAVSDDGLPVVSSHMMRRALEYATMLGMPVVNHAEDPTMVPKWSMHEGEVSTRLGLAGLPAAGEEIMIARDIILAEMTGGQLHVPHISTRGAVALVREAKKRGVRVTAEVSPHHFSLTDEAVIGFDPNTKMNPPLRGRADVEAMLEGLADGTLDCIATDHAPHHPDEKALEYDNAPCGIIGLETAVSLALDRLVHGGVLDLPAMVRCFTSAPAAIFHLDKGSLTPGADGDITIIDLRRPAVVDARRFRSLSRNTPFQGMELRGGPVMTIVGGDLVWQLG